MRVGETRQLLSDTLRIVTIPANVTMPKPHFPYLGAGVNLETRTWGNMLQDGQRLIQRAWWPSLFPGFALVILILSLNLLGDALRDALDPRERGR
jgi:peptide/nickel transport system permease protein